MGCLGDEPKVKRGVVLDYLERKKCGKTKDLGAKKGSVLPKWLLVDMYVRSFPVPDQCSLSCPLVNSPSVFFS